MSRRWLRELRTAQWLWTPTLAFGVTRLAMALVIYFAAPIVADNPVDPPYHLRDGAHVIVDALGSRWDTGFYVSIAEDGYKYEGVSLPSVPFFPLMPLAMVLVSFVVGDAVIAGLIVANVSLLLASVLLYRVAEADWGQTVAERATWYFLIFPASLFGSAVYAESLFLATLLGSWYCAKSSRWALAGLLSILVCATRFLGLLIVPMLVLEWWAQRRRGSVGKPGVTTGWYGLLAALAGPLGTVSYMIFLKLKFNDPLAFSHGAAAWGRHFQSPVGLIRQSFERPPDGWLLGLLDGQIHLDNMIDLTFAATFLAFGVAILVQRRWGEGLFVFLGALAPLSTGMLMSQRRYVWVLFPAFILLARCGVAPWVDRIVTAVSLMMLAYFTVLFANGYWVA